MQYDVPNFSERTEPSQVASDRLKITYESERCGQDRPKNLSDDSQLSRIEQLITGKQFSRYVVISNIFSPNSLLMLSSYCLYYQILTVVLLWFFYFKWCVMFIMYGCCFLLCFVLKAIFLYELSAAKEWSGSSFLLDKFQCHNLWL